MAASTASQAPTAPSGCSANPRPPLPSGSSRRVLRINPRTGNVRLIGPELGPATNIKFKWLRGILASDNAIYCIPANATDVLKIQTFPSGEEPVISTIGGAAHGPLAYLSTALSVAHCGDVIADTVALVSRPVQPSRVAVARRCAGPRRQHLRHPLQCRECAQD